jgi:hypothetical protein
MIGSLVKRCDESSCQVGGAAGEENIAAKLAATKAKIFIRIGLSKKR